jgi:hypothetical protein
VPRRRLRPTLMHARSDVAVSAEAVAAMQCNTGLVVVIGEYRGDTCWNAFSRWHEDEYVPTLLGTGLFSGVARFVSEATDLRDTYVLLCYTDLTRADEAYVEFIATSAGWGGGPYADGHRQLFSGVYQPSIGRYDVYP